jgi:fumarate reductase subunit D
MQLLQKNEFWMLFFSGGLLYWLFNPSVLMTLVMIIPLLIGIASKK